MPLILETPYALRDLLGREIAMTEWVTVSQERIQQFADVTDDRQWIHIDRERASRESPYGTTIAHGFLTLSLLSKFLRDAIKIQSGVRMSVNYGLNRVRFPAPGRRWRQNSRSFHSAVDKGTTWSIGSRFQCDHRSRGSGKALLCR